MNSLFCSICQKTAYCPAMQNFLKDHKLLMQERLMSSFLKEAANEELFFLAVCHPSPEHDNLLNQTFQQFYEDRQFLNYLSTTLYWEAVHYDQHTRQHQETYTLMAEPQLLQLEAEDHVEKSVLEKQLPLLQDKLSDPLLQKAYRSLTLRQKEVLHFIYVEGLLFRETGEKLNISQQGVSSIHKSAMQKLRHAKGRKQSESLE